MEENKQIEEMAKYIKTANEINCIRTCDNCEYYNDDSKCISFGQAIALYNAGYRKIPEGSVVLSREEYERLLTRPLNAMGDLVIGKIKNKKKCGYDKDDICVNSDSEHLTDYCPLKEELVQARKETAREIIEYFDLWLVEDFEEMNDNDFIHIMKKDFVRRRKELAKQHGVEVK